jgi:hypothetical protein
MRKGACSFQVQKRVFSLSLSVLLLGVLANLPAIFVEAAPLATPVKNTPAKAENGQKKSLPVSKAKSKTPPGKITTEPSAGPVLDETMRHELDTLGQGLDPETKASVNTLSGVIHEQDQLIDNEIRDEETEAFSNIGMLWSAAVEHNHTIRYTVEKLSRRDATGKPVANDTVSKRLLQSLVNLGGVAGTMWTGTPASLIGSNMVQGMMAGNPSESALSRVTDADMVILAREVDTLQTRLITLYYNYQQAQERLKLTREANAVVTQAYHHAVSKTDANQAALQPLMQSMQESARQNEHAAQQALISAQNELSILVGPEAINALDKKTPRN